MQQKVNHVHDEVRFAAGQRTYISVDRVLLVMASDGWGVVGIRWYRRHVARRRLLAACAGFGYGLSDAFALMARAAVLGTAADTSECRSGLFSKSESLRAGGMLDSGGVVGEVLEQETGE